MEPNSRLVSTTSSFSSLSSSNPNSESTLSFFPDNNITLGTLIGYRPDPLPPRRSLSSVHPVEEQVGHMEIFAGRSRSQTGTQRGWWDFMPCASFKDGAGEDGMSSLGHFLQAERRGGRSPVTEKVYINIMYEESDTFMPEANPLFVESLLLQAVPESQRELEYSIEETSTQSLRALMGAAHACRNVDGSAGVIREGRCHSSSATRELHPRRCSQSSWCSSVCAFHCMPNTW